MSVISDDLKNKIRQTARNRCGYCLTPQEIVTMLFEIEHICPVSEGGTDAKENLWQRVETATVSNTPKLTPLTRKPKKKRGSLTRALKLGKNILNSTGTKPKSSAKHLADALPLSLCD